MKVTIIFTGGAAADIRKAIALHDTLETEDYPHTFKRGEIIVAVSQYRVKKTGEKTVCSHGGRQTPDDPDDHYYDIDVIRSKVPPEMVGCDSNSSGQTLLSCLHTMVGPTSD